MQALNRQRSHGDDPRVVEETADRRRFRHGVADSPNPAIERKIGTLLVHSLAMSAHRGYNVTAMVARRYAAAST